MSRNLIVITAAAAALSTLAVTPTMARGGGWHGYPERYIAVCTACPKPHVALNPGIFGPSRPQSPPQKPH